jgi:hypothetical protein
LLVLTGEAEVAVAATSNPARRWLSDDHLGQEDQGMECHVARAPCEKKNGAGEKGGDNSAWMHLNGVTEGGMESGGGGSGMCGARGIWHGAVRARWCAASVAASKQRLAAAAWRRRRVQQRSMHSAAKEQSNWANVDTDKRALARMREQEGG